MARVGNSIYKAKNKTKKLKNKKRKGKRENKKYNKKQINQTLGVNITCDLYSFSFVFLFHFF